MAAEKAWENKQVSLCTREVQEARLKLYMFMREYDILSDIGVNFLLQVIQRLLLPKQKGRREALADSRDLWMSWQSDAE